MTIGLWMSVYRHSRNSAREQTAEPIHQHHHHHIHTTEENSAIAEE
jgi:hypothetical protein